MEFITNSLKLKYPSIYLIAFLAITESCHFGKSDTVFEGFVLGQKIDIKAIEKKFGENTLNYYYKRLEKPGLEVRIYGLNNNTWNYTFTNGTTHAFVDFADLNSYLIGITIRVGRLTLKYPGKEGYEGFYDASEIASRDDIAYLKSLMLEKYGSPTKETNNPFNPDSKTLEWDFKSYSVELTFNEKTLTECNIKYFLDIDAVQKIKKETEDEKMRNQIEKM